MLGMQNLEESIRSCTDVDILHSLYAKYQGGKYPLPRLINLEMLRYLIVYKPGGIYQYLKIMDTLLFKEDSWVEVFSEVLNKPYVDKKAYILKLLRKKSLKLAEVCLEHINFDVDDIFSWLIGSNDPVNDQIASLLIRTPKFRWIKEWVVFVDRHPTYAYDFLSSTRELSKIDVMKRDHLIQTIHASSELKNKWGQRIFISAVYDNRRDLIRMFSEFLNVQSLNSLSGKSENLLALVEVFGLDTLQPLFCECVTRFRDTLFLRLLCYHGYLYPQNIETILPSVHPLYLHEWLIKYIQWEGSNIDVVMTHFKRSGKSLTLYEAVSRHPQFTGTIEVDNASYDTLTLKEELELVRNVSTWLPCDDSLLSLFVNGPIYQQTFLISQHRRQTFWTQRNTHIQYIEKKECVIL